MTKSAGASISYIGSVFELFFHYRLELSAGETATQCRAPEPQIEAVLEKLKERGWLRYNPTTGKYQYGMRMLPFTREETLRLELVRQYTPVMKQLSEDCRQSVMLNVLDSMHSVCIHKIEPRNAIHIDARVGKDSPLHAGSSSRVLLAYAPEAVRNAVLSSQLERYTPFTIMSPEKLSESLFEIRRTGYASSSEERDPGAGAVSCAILDDSNNLLGCLSIIGTRFAYEKEGALWKALLFAAIRRMKLK